jgi:hypothetical protein
MIAELLEELSRTKRTLLIVEARALPASVQVALYTKNDFPKALDHLDPETPAYNPDEIDFWYEFGKHTIEREQERWRQENSLS